MFSRVVTSGYRCRHSVIVKIEEVLVRILFILFQIRVPSVVIALLGTRVLTSVRITGAQLAVCGPFHGLLYMNFTVNSHIAIIAFSLSLQL